LGWHEQDPAPGGEPLWFLGIRVISGRVADTAAQRLRSGIRAVVERYRPEVRLTAQQNLLLAGIRAADRAGMEALLNAHGVRQASSLPPVLRHSMACPALPTCGQALAEAERALPLLAEEIQAELNRVGLGTQEIQVRMTGCPNGCARPYTAEIGIVGQSVDLYSLYLGGSPFNTRLARLYRHGIPVRAVAAALRPFFEAYAAGRQPGERFGDYIERVGLRVLEPAAEEVA
jgi:sulfite reductase (ferredoxin)